MQLRSIITLLSLISGFAYTSNACVLLGVPTSHSQGVCLFEGHLSDHGMSMVKASSVVDTVATSEADVLEKLSDILASSGTAEEPVEAPLELNASLEVKSSPNNETYDIVVD